MRPVRVLSAHPVLSQTLRPNSGVKAVRTQLTFLRAAQIKCFNPGFVKLRQKPHGVFDQRVAYRLGIAVNERISFLLQVLQMRTDNAVPKPVKVLAVTRIKKDTMPVESCTDRAIAVQQV
jgi:hypothetical protein